MSTPTCEWPLAGRTCANPRRPGTTRCHLAEHQGPLPVAGVGPAGLRGTAPAGTPARAEVPELQGKQGTFYIRRDTAARTEAITALYPRPAGVEDQVREMAGKKEKATVLISGHTMLGSPIIRVYSGRLFEAGDGRIGILPGGNTRNGNVVGGEGEEILDVLPGAGVKVARTMNERWHAVVPATVPVTREELKAATEDAPIAVVYTHPGFIGGDGPTPGCVWLLDYFDEDSDVVGGFMWAPEGSGLFSEHGSIEVERLVRDGALVTKEPMIDSIVEGYDLPAHPTEAYRALFW